MLNAVIFSVRRALVLDAPLLAELHARSFPEPWSADFVAALLGQPSVIGLLLTNEEPAGFLLARAAAGEAEILTLAVDPAHRRRRCATSLCEALLAAFRDAKAEDVFLEVAADNAAALALYAGLGFRAVGRRPDYYAAPESDALLLRLTLR